MLSRRVLITGGSGMVGRKVRKMLLHYGIYATNASLPKYDLRNFNLCKAITENKDYVFHLAGIKGSPLVTRGRPADFFVPMLQMNTNVLEACRLNKVSGVVYTSSGAAYHSDFVLKESNPELTPMDKWPGWAKRMGEMQIQAYKRQYRLKGYCAVRLSNVYGEWDNFDPDTGMFISATLGKIKRGDNPVVVWGDGSEIRDFVYCGDIAKALIRIMEHPFDGPFLNLGSNTQHSVEEVINILHEFIDFNHKFDTMKQSGFPRRVMDSSLAKELIGYEPKTKLREGLEITWNWLKQH